MRLPLRSRFWSEDSGDVAHLRGDRKLQYGE